MNGRVKMARWGVGIGRHESGSYAAAICEAIYRKWPYAFGMFGLPPTKRRVRISVVYNFVDDNEVTEWECDK